ncbi:hypothetical protein ABW20_dc0104056 [Dactylellina cionopaga]|nr:hypothetical protein ABW20_dc0104056 [Dactylellina cionopaga]
MLNPDAIKADCCQNFLGLSSTDGTCDNEECIALSKGDIPNPAVPESKPLPKNPSSSKMLEILRKVLVRGGAPEADLKGVSGDAGGAARAKGPGGKPINVPAAAPLSDSDAKCCASLLKTGEPAGACDLMRCIGALNDKTQREMVLVSIFPEGATKNDAKAEATTSKHRTKRERAIINRLPVQPDQRSTNLSPFH